MEEKLSDSVKIYYPRFDKKKIVEYLRAKVPELKEKIPLASLILFGSYTKNRYNAASDIDILIIYKGNKLKDDYHIIWDSIQLPEAQLHIYTLDEFRKLKSSGSSFPKEVENGIIIYSDVEE
ncbi:MAG: nucleotidyltransferase domain-containing protein [Nitrososphaeria archaeon]|nr:nucleotidyltransferase domain-containing protein [Nitrososphaeria archaeon]